jgi:hypothetical protein
LDEHHGGSIRDVSLGPDRRRCGANGIRVSRCGAAVVTTVGTGNITVQATASSVASNKVFTLPTPLAYVAQSSLLLTNIVATTSTQLTNPGAAQKTLTICTLPASPANVWLNPAGGSAVVNQGLPVWSGGGCTPINPPPTGVLYGISDGTSSVSITASGG